MSLARPYTTTFDISNINVPSSITVTKWQATNALVVTKPATPATLTDICIHAGWELTADHANTPVDHANSPADHANTPVDHANSPAGHANTPADHANTPADHANSPVAKKRWTRTIHPTCVI